MSNTPQWPEKAPDVWWQKSIDQLLWRWRERVAFTLNESENLSELNALGREVHRFLDSRVSWQPEAKLTLARICSKIWSPVSFRKWPLGSVLFAGPSGAWKNILVESLAEFFLWDKHAFTRYDAGKTSSGKTDNWWLFWSTPWYADGDIEPILGPDSVYDYCLRAQAKELSHASISDLDDFWIVMIDEVDQLPLSILKALYGLMDEDEIDMNRWEPLITKNLIVIFTTNHWWEQWKKFIDELHSGNTSKYDSHSQRNTRMKHIVWESVNKKFPAGFMSRVDLVCFDFLEEENVDEMVDMFFQEINVVGEKYGFSFQYTPEVYSFFRSRLSEEHGGRPIGKMLTNLVWWIANNFIHNKANEKYFHLPHGGIQIEVDVKGWNIVSCVTVDAQVDAYVKDGFSHLIQQIQDLDDYEYVVLYMYKEYLKYLGIDISEIDIKLERDESQEQEGFSWETPIFFRTARKMQVVDKPSNEHFETLRRENSEIFSYLSHGPRLKLLLESEEFSDIVSLITHNPEVSTRVISTIVFRHLSRINNTKHFDRYVNSKSPHMKQEICDTLHIGELHGTLQAQFIQAVQDRKWAVERAEASKK